MLIGNILNQNFGKYLKEMRISHNASALTRKVGISYVYLLDIEKGARPAPKNNVLKSLAENLNLNNEQKEHFFDLAAEERTELPVDVVDYMHSNKGIIHLVRHLKNANLTTTGIEKCIEQIKDITRNEDSND